MEDTHCKISYLPNKHSLVRKGNWGPSAPFLFMTTISGKISVIAVGLNTEGVNTSNNEQRIYDKKDAENGRIIGVAYGANGNGQSEFQRTVKKFEFCASIVHGTK